eukprot:3500734-Prymnesium_polylepis.1
MNRAGADYSTQLMLFTPSLGGTGTTGFCRAPTPWRGRRGAHGAFAGCRRGAAGRGARVLALIGVWKKDDQGVGETL